MKHIIFHNRPVPQSTNCKKQRHMNLQKLFIRSGLFFLLIFCGARAMAQGPYPNTGNHSVCVNATEPYGVVLTPGSTYAWTITPIAGGNGTITAGATSNLISVHWTSIGT